MRSPFLRSFRIFFSILVLICFIIAFSDFKNVIPVKWIDWLLFFQFIPSILNFIDIRSLAAAGFIAVIIITLITGRTYCSFLCPLGIGQDINSRIGGKIRKKFRRYGFKKAHTVLRYSVLTATLAVSFTWGIYLLTLLDPYSIFGRFMTFFMKPAIIVINNFFAGLLNKFNIFTLAHLPVNGYHLLVYTIPLIFFILIGALSLAKGRLYCNMICPVGTFLGLLSKVSLFRIKIDENKCDKCGRCTVYCKSSCIDFLGQHVDLSRCVECFNCIRSCPSKAISFGLPGVQKKMHVNDPGKRKFVAATIGFLVGLPALARGMEGRGSDDSKRLSTVKENKRYPVSPPGSGGIDNLKKDCTACSTCISACPNGVIQPALFEYGLTGIMLPVLDFHKGFCDYNCIRCIEVCPTNALKPLSIGAKRLTQLGKAYFISENCIVTNEKTACGACSEACPTKAVEMVPYEGNLKVPHVNNETCTGCGHCEYACPTVPFKAIHVDGNPVHLAASPPVIDTAEKEPPVEFPF
jgi:ferredoxin-type protein NapF